MRVKEAGEFSPTVELFELAGCPSRAAKKLALWPIDARISHDQKKVDLVLFDDRINPCRCVICRAHSPYYQLLFRVKAWNGKELPVRAGNIITDLCSRASMLNE